MRAGIGLLSLLIVAALIFYLSIGTKAHPGYDSTVLEKGRTAKQEASQISGKTEDNTPIKDTIKLEEVDSGGQFRRVKVISVVAKTPMDTVYGLMPGDEITRVGDWGVTDNNDYELAAAKIAEAFSRNDALVVMRNGEQMTLTPSSSPLSKLLGGTKPTAPPATPALPPGVSVPAH